MNTLLCHVPNNHEGQTFLKVLKQSLRGTPKGVWARSRGPRKPHAKGDKWTHARFRQDLPREHATHFAVYLTDKPYRNRVAASRRRFTHNTVSNG